MAPCSVFQSTVECVHSPGYGQLGMSFDGHKGHIAIDLDSEIITATMVSAGNAGDASVAEVLIKVSLLGHFRAHHP
jgi:hypothetical protein